jgi:hypothetical protein
MLRDRRAIVGRARCRPVSFGSVRPGDIAAELAIIDASNIIEELTIGRVGSDAVLVDGAELDALQTATGSWTGYPLFQEEIPI